MDIPFYKTIFSQIFMTVYTIVGIFTAIICYKLSNKKHLRKVTWTILGYLFPVIPYIYLKLKYKD